VERLTEITNSETSANEPESELDEIIKAAVRRRGRRGRPKGTGRKRVPGATPKSFRHFTPVSHVLVKRLLLGGQCQPSEEEIIEEALIRLAQSRSNEIPGLATYLKRIGR
jgi:hypothetical protein